MIFSVENQWNGSDSFLILVVHLHLIHQYPQVFHFTLRIVIWHIFWGNNPGKNFLRLSQLNTTKGWTNTYYNSPWFTSTYFDSLKIIHNLLPNAISHLVLLSHFQISNVILKLSQVRYKSLRVINTPQR